MPNTSPDLTARLLLEAEGYLELGLPQRCLEILQARSDWATMQFEACFLMGEAFRALNRFREALRPLEQAAALRPSNIHVAFAQGWCYKRTNRLAQAIDALQRAVRFHPEVPLLHYNLACYWSLAGNLGQTLETLAEAFKLDPDLRNQVASEPDFDPVRNQPAFQRLLAQAVAKKGVRNLFGQG
jgi:tetratricopeptide (TPR) repeat protein